MFPVRTILHPTDFSAYSQAAFGVACALARDYGARLIVLHVGVPPTPIVPEAMLAFDTGLFEAELRAKLNAIEFPEGVYSLERRLVLATEPVTEILETARRERCDLIVMGTHGRTGLRQLVMGSVAEQVLREASCPVLTVRAPLPALAEEGAGAAGEVRAVASI